MISIKALAKASGTYLNRVNVYCQENDTVKSANVTVQVLNSDLRINKTTADTKNQTLWQQNYIPSGKSIWICSHTC